MTIIPSYLTPSEFTRPEKIRKKTEAIIVHWVANPQQRAADVRQFWEDREGSYGSAHAIVDLDGTILQALPWDEVGYHVGSSKGYTELAEFLFGTRAISSASSPNFNTIGIEMCHQNWEGEFTDHTIRGAAQVVAKLCLDYSLNPFRHVLTHQMVVGWKDCPRWFVEHPEDLEHFRWQVYNSI